MALPEYKLGDFKFLGILGNHSPIKEIVNLAELPGIDGTAIIKEGAKGRPFMIRTWVDCANYGQAVGEYNYYTLMSNRNDPLELVICGVSSETLLYRVHVLDVRPVDIRACRLGGTGLNPPSLAYVEAEWDLIATGNYLVVT